MPERVTREELIGEVAQGTKLNKKDVAGAIDALFHSMKQALARGERIELRGFGVFTVKPRKRGVAANPSTDEEVTIRSSKFISFMPGKELSSGDLFDQTQAVEEYENIEEIIQHCIQEVDEARTIAESDREKIEILKIETREILRQF